jgi:proteic killer suppression protein
MIASFRSSVLRRYWFKGEAGGLRPDWRNKVRLVLSRLDVARHPSELASPGMGFHTLKGFDPKRYAVTVSRNWRITFAWDGEDATDVDREDYHGS